MNLFPYYKQVALDTGSADHVDLNTDVVKAALVEGYTYDATDKYLSDVIATATVVARSNALTTPTVANGTFDADDTIVNAVATGHTITSVILYKETGTDATCTLVGHIDKAQDGTTPLSQVTNGSSITVGFHPSGIYDI